MMNSFLWGSNDSRGKGIHCLSWSNMSMLKGAGGLGFRDLYNFNLALLVKNCWNLLSNPTSLMERAFKERYFNNTILFAVTRGGGVGFVWLGLWQAKEVFKQVL